MVLAAGAVEHGRGEVSACDMGLWEAFGKREGEVAGAAGDVEDARRVSVD